MVLTEWNVGLLCCVIEEAVVKSGTEWGLPDWKQ